MTEAPRHGAREAEEPTGNAAHLDALEEAVNKRIDTDVESLMENYKEIINLSRVRPLLSPRLAAKTISM